MKKSLRTFIATSSILVSLSFGMTACSGPDKEAQASASASAQALQSLDSRATLESFFVSVQADTVSSAKESKSGFQENYKQSLEYVADSVSDEDAEELITKVGEVFADHPNSTIGVDESKAKFDGGKATFSFSDLIVYTDGNASDAAIGEGSITLSSVDGKTLITSSDTD